MEITSSPTNLLLLGILAIITLALSLYLLYPLYDFCQKRRHQQEAKYKALRIWLSSLGGVLVLLYSLNLMQTVYIIIVHHYY
ncbi:hypothetical protein OZX69_05965 [Lactobacillus sp. ESL0731]|uniref:hypothetical protein n=1 Tax=unclassified Lactobacillus TaxID=2620435 RepID=UPI0023F97E09|nr:MULTISPECIES: hypothetical protein [unclassified Lactobacillus]WEV50507.1 hypothetical protein OZX63_05960 [Lactobacillus sp. ESL0700]WEV61637.1 hypothetical protein OZX69_05965 [Lactobacillus sp. ESL0731]